jgi:hypothetical protein
MKEFNGNISVQSGMVGLENRGHPTLTKLSDDPVRSNHLSDGERHYPLSSRNDVVRKKDERSGCCVRPLGPSLFVH